MVRTATYFTLSQAAKATGKSKSVISKALNDGTLSHVGKDDSGYQIDPAELFRVFPQNPVLEQERERSRTPVRTGENYLENASFVNSLEVENKLLHARILDKDERIGELKEQCEHWKTEKDRWHEAAQRLLLTYQPTAKTSQEGPEAQREGAGGDTQAKPENIAPDAKKSLLVTVGAAALVAAVATVALQYFDAEIRAGLNQLLGNVETSENGAENTKKPVENQQKNANRGSGETISEPIQSYPQSLPDPL